MKILNRFTEKLIREIKTLREADLHGANLHGADLRRADLHGADLDFSCLPLWCGSFDMKADSRLIFQLIAHITRIDKVYLSIEAKRAIRSLDEWKNEFCKYGKDIKEI